MMVTSKVILLLKDMDLSEWWPASLLQMKVFMKVKLHMELSPDTTENTKKEKKLQLTQLPVSSLGLED